MSEHTEQAAVIQWAAYNLGNYPDLVLLHAIPNGAKLPYSKNDNGKRYSSEAVHLIAEGLKGGVPDLSLPVARGGYFGLYIEMKVKPNKPSEKQLEFIGLLADQGYMVQICYSAEEAITLLEKYLSQEKTFRGHSVTF